MTIAHCLLRWFHLAIFAIMPIAVSAILIKDIQVKSATIKIKNPEFVLAHTSVRAGEDIDRQKISNDVKSLLKTDKFSSVNAELTPIADGYILTFQVEIKPALGSPIIVSGADAISDKQIREWLDLNTGDRIDNSILFVRSRKILEEYGKRYYYNPDLSWDIDVDPATGFATVHFFIDEGERASVRKIYFEGNTYVPPTLSQQIFSYLTRKPIDVKSVSPNELIKPIKHQLWHIFSFITKRGKYNPDILEANRTLLTTIYQNHGYLDAEIGNPIIHAYKPQKIDVTYPLNEGKRYSLGRITLSGLTLFPESNLWAVISIKRGDIASRKEIYQNAANLCNYYRSRGYLRTTVAPEISAKKTEPVVDINFAITESQQIKVRYIDIYGNTKTKDRVIRRELLICPGQVYDQVCIKRSEHILKNLGFFSSVSSYPRETLASDQNDLVFEVEEKATGQFLMGAGYSSIDELVGFIELSQGNFDIFGWPYFTGGGQKIRIRTQFGTEREDYQLSFVEPWFLGRKLSLGLDLYDTSSSYLSDMYDQQRFGGALTLGMPVQWFFQRADLQYSLEQITIFDISDDAITRIKNEEGSRTASNIRLTLTHDTRDSFFLPTRGNKTTLSAHISGGPLDMDTDVYGFHAESLTYFPLWFKHVFSIHLLAKVVDEYGESTDVPLFNRLYLGGARSLRGFKYRYVGPYEEDEPIGGKSSALASIEYTIPIVKMLRFASFYELGNVWLDSYDFDLSDYCSDAGIGLRVDIPGFPIRLDYAWPIEISGDVERTAARFNFWLGYGF